MPLPASEIGELIQGVTPPITSCGWGRGRELEIHGAGRGQCCGTRALGRGGRWEHVTGSRSTSSKPTSMAWSMSHQPSTDQSKNAADELHKVLKKSVDWQSQDCNQRPCFCIPLFCPSGLGGSTPVFLAMEFHIPFNQAPSPSLFETAIWIFNRCSNRNLFVISGCAISSLRFR